MSGSSSAAPVNCRRNTASSADCGRDHSGLQLWRQGVLQWREQGLADVVLRIAEHFPHRALLNDVPMFEHHDAITDLADHCHFMGDQNDGQAQALVDLAQQPEDRCVVFGSSAEASSHSRIAGSCTSAGRSTDALF